MLPGSGAGSDAGSPDVGTAGPSHSGPDYNAGWAFGRELHVPILDEHYYVSPDWFWDHLNFYDKYPRGNGEVYLGEYAAHDQGRKSTLRAALAEAAYLTSLERNGDVVRLASYAPLLAKRGLVNWAPDLIYFDNTTVSPTISYDVQKLFSHHAGDQSLPVRMESSKELAVSCVRDSKTGDVIVKLVSRSDQPIEVAIDFSSLGQLTGKAKCLVLAGDAMSEDAFGQPPTVTPVESTLTINQKTLYSVPPHSLSVICVPRSQGSAD